MTPLPFLVVALGASAAALLVRERERASVAIALGGFVLALAAAGAMDPSASIEIGGDALAGSAYTRLFAIFGCLVGLGLALLGLLTSSHPHAPGVLLGGLGAAVLALALPDPRLGVLAVTAGGLVGVLVTVVHRATAREAVVAVRELRAVAIAGSLAILATAWIGRPLEDLVADPAVFGFAYLGFALAVAIRFGAIPFHFWAARLADATDEIALPMLMAWIPAAFAIVALAWVDASVAPLLLPLGLERAVVAGIGAVTIVLGLLAAWIQDDLEHVVGYTIIADAGVAILALAALDPAAWEPARSWLLVFVMARSAFAAWAVAIRGRFGTRRIPELPGWALRSPLLALGLVVIVAASVGWPGLLAWDARRDLAALALPGPIAAVVGFAAIASLAIYGRLALVGLGQPSEQVRGAEPERPRWPSALPARPIVGRGGMERAFERTGHALSGALDVLWTVPAAIRLNGGTIAALIVLVLAGLAFVVASGGAGVVDAARAVPGQPGEAPLESPRPGASPTPEASLPVVTEPPLGSPTPTASASPSQPSFLPIPT